MYPPAITSQIKVALVRLALTKIFARTNVSQTDVAAMWVGSGVSQHMRGLHLCIQHLHEHWPLKQIEDQKYQKYFFSQAVLDGFKWIAATV